LIDVDGNLLIEGEFIFICLRPDILKPNRLLGFGIDKQLGATKVIDLQNHILNEQNLIEILSNKIGIVEVSTIKELILKEENMSDISIRKENIKNIIQTYNVFVKADIIEFNSTDFDTQEKLEAANELFTELNIKSMSINQLLNTINSGMNDYYLKMNELRDSNLSNEEKIQKTLTLSTLQGNLILFFEETLRKMDSLIGEQHKELEALKKQLEK
jgi:formyltetrahydrofolate synthetase